MLCSEFKHGSCCGDMIFQLVVQLLHVVVVVVVVVVDVVARCGVLKLFVLQRPAI